MKTCQFPGCNKELPKYGLKWCMEHRVIVKSSQDREHINILREQMGRKPFVPKPEKTGFRHRHAAYCAMILNHNVDDGSKMKQLTFSERPYMTGSEMVIGQGRKRGRGE